MLHGIGENRVLGKRCIIVPIGVPYRFPLELCGFPTPNIGIVDLISVLSSCACAWWLQLFVRMCVMTSTLLWVRAHVRDDFPVGTSGDHLGPLGTIWDQNVPKQTKIWFPILIPIIENKLCRNGCCTTWHIWKIHIGCNFMSAHLGILRPSAFIL